MKKELTREHKRIQIAEACGWKCQDHVREEDKPYALMCWVAPGDDPWHLQVPPDYFNDLNAIHSAIMNIIVHGKDIVQYRSNEDLFQYELDKIIEREQVAVWHFSAELYAEALLKTLNL